RPRRRREVDVARVFGDLDDDLLGAGLRDRLAPEPRREREPLGSVEVVLFLVGHLRELVEALLHDHVARRARQIATTLVLDINSMSQSDVEDRERSSIVLEGRLRRIDFELDPFGLEADLHGRTSSRRLPLTVARATSSRRTSESGSTVLFMASSAAWI